MSKDAEIKQLKELNKKLIDRLNATQCAIDSSLQSLEEQGFTGLEESDFYTELTGELAPNEELLKSIEDKQPEYLFKSGSVILKGEAELIKHIRDRKTDDKNECTDEFLINEALNLGEYVELEEVDKELLEAMDKVDIQLINDLKHGDEIELNDKYTIYKYTEEDVIVINETEEWEEVLQVMINGDKIEFESLI